MRVSDFQALLIRRRRTTFGVQPEPTAQFDREPGATRPTRHRARPYRLGVGDPQGQVNKVAAEVDQWRRRHPAGIPASWRSVEARHHPGGALDSLPTDREADGESPVEANQWGRMKRRQLERLIARQTGRLLHKRRYLGSRACLSMREVQLGRGANENRIQPLGGKHLLEAVVADNADRSPAAAGIGIGNRDQVDILYVRQRWEVPTHGHKPATDKAEPNAGFRRTHVRQSVCHGLPAGLKYADPPD